MTKDQTDYVSKEAEEILNRLRDLDNYVIQTMTCSIEQRLEDDINQARNKMANVCGRLDIYKQLI